MSSVIIGIDLGITNTCAYVFHEDKFQFIPTKNGGRTLRSFVYYKSENELFVGKEAEKQITNTKNGIYDIKRIIGRTFTELQKTKFPKLWPFQIEPNENDGCVILLEFNTNNGIKVVRKRPEEIYAEILKEVLKNARRFLNREVTEAVISVPAYFKTGQTNATITAAEIAGLKKVHLVQEPTAAALAFADDKNLEKSLLLVYDFGGGSFNSALVEIDEENTYFVKAVAGLRSLGGCNIDNNLVTYFWRQIQVEFKRRGIECTKIQQEKIKEKLLTACKQLKIGLTQIQSDCIELDDILDEDDIRIEEELTRYQFNKINESTICKTFDSLLELVTDQNCKNDITHILLIGGSSRIPLVKDKLGKFFSGKELSILAKPDEAVALGAAIKGKQLMPKVEKMPFSIVILAGRDRTKKLFEKNAPIPNKFEDIYLTNRDKQTEVDIELYKYDEETRTTSLLTKITVTNIEPKKRGIARIRVKFIVNSSGILEIEATATYTHKKEKVESILDYSLSSPENAQPRKNINLLARL